MKFQYCVNHNCVAHFLVDLQFPFKCKHLVKLEILLLFDSIVQKNLFMDFCKAVNRKEHSKSNLKRFILCFKNDIHFFLDVKPQVKSLKNLDSETPNPNCVLILSRTLKFVPKYLFWCFDFAIFKSRESGCTAKSSKDQLEN